MSFCFLLCLLQTPFIASSVNALTWNLIHIGDVIHQHLLSHTIMRIPTRTSTRKFFASCNFFPFHLALMMLLQCCIIDVLKHCFSLVLLTHQRHKTTASCKLQCALLSVDPMRPLVDASCCHILTHIPPSVLPWRAFITCFLSFSFLMYLL